MAGVSRFKLGFLQINSTDFGLRYGPKHLSVSMNIKDGHRSILVKGLWFLSKQIERSCQISDLGSRYFSKTYHFSVQHMISKRFWNPANVLNYQKKMFDLWLYIIMGLQEMIIIMPNRLNILMVRKCRQFHKTRNQYLACFAAKVLTGMRIQVTFVLMLSLKWKT